MDSGQKLTGLKKAYTDIILNISKEAAARVMSSERRAARCEHELKVGREEGFRMLMRLKQMMDYKISQSDISQISQSDIASQNQQKKIEELEAQLNEAEDIVKDLREELEEAHAEIERLKKDNSLHSNEPTHAFKRGMKTSGIYSFDKCGEFHYPNSEEFFSDATMAKPGQRNGCCKCNSAIVCTCCSYSRNRDLPSIILRGKEAGLYRNSCTQRIRACVKNLSDSALCYSGETDRVNDENNIREQLQREHEEGEDTSTAQAFESKSLTELERKLLQDNKFSNFKSFPQKGKRATRARKIISPLNGKHVPILVKDGAYLHDNLTETAPMLSQLKTETQTHSGPEKSSGKVTNLVEISGDIIIMQKDEGEIGFAESFTSPDCKIEVEKTDLPPNDIESKCSPSVRERVIKYTFQRKRKREAFLSGSKVNDAEIDTEKETVVEQKGDEKSKTKEESSRESRRLAQVARQLISLSERKWWN